MRKLLVISVVMLMFLTGCTSANEEIILSDNTAIDTVEAPEQIEEELPASVVVYICGAVVNPGVYELTDGSRIDDAVKAAGGFSEDADRTYVNLAAKVSDGSKLQIPTVTETSDQSFAKGIDSFESATDGSGLININTASQTQLATLPGIGEGIAGKIIKYREENGSFKKIEDIMKVSGIKDKLFSKIKDHITV